MKKEIKIQIPDNLSKEDEAILISKKLIQKSISGTGVNEGQLRIGDKITLIDQETIIRVVRVSKEKPIEFCPCPVCSVEYQSNTASYYFTNYGGTIRKLPVCSPACVDVIVAAFPGRVAAKKSKLARVRPF